MTSQSHISGDVNKQHITISESHTQSFHSATSSLESFKIESQPSEVKSITGIASVPAQVPQTKQELFDNTLQPSQSTPAPLQPAQQMMASHSSTTQEAVTQPTSANAPGAAPTQNTPLSLSDLQNPQTFSLGTSTPPMKKKMSKSDFTQQGGGISKAGQDNKDDPLSSLDPLWSIKK